MTANERQERKAAVLELIVQRPNIRLIEIADKLDIDPEIVETVIRDELNSGIVSKGEVLAPNGRMQPCFLHTQIVAGAGAAPDIDVPVTRRDRPELQVLKDIHARVSTVTTKPKTKGELALAYLLDNSPAPSPFLSRAIGIPEKTSPHSYIGTVMSAGYVVYENKEWSITDAGRAYLAKQPIKPTKEAAPMNAEKTTINIPQFAAAPALRTHSHQEQEQPESTTAPVPASPVPSSPVPTAPLQASAKVDAQAKKFLAGLFSNGELVIEQDGQEIRLTPENAVALVRYARKIEPVVLSE